MHPHIGPLLNKKSAIYMLNLLSIGNHSIFTQLFYYTKKDTLTSVKMPNLEL